jgi:hypothetical protein
MRHNKKYLFVTLFSLVVTACASIATPQVITPTTGQPPAATTTIASPTITATITSTPTPAIPPTITPTPTGPWIGLTPDTGLPGTTVQIDGYLPGGLPEADLQANDNKTHADVCWDSCLNGLVIGSQEVDWSASEPGRFTLRFTTPVAPWLKADGPHPMKPGDYTVGLQCLGPDQTGCALVESQTKTIFHLHGPVSNACQEGSCGRLAATPSSGAPGTQIQVEGWAPLRQITDNAAFGYSLVLEPQSGAPSPAQFLNLVGSVDQKLDGSLTASFLVPQRGPDQAPIVPDTYLLALEAPGFSPENSGAQVMVAPTPFEITAAPSWTQLKQPKPLWIQPSASIQATTMSVDALNPDGIAYCAPGVIRLSQGAGKTWISIPASGASRLAQASPYPLFSQETPDLPTCTSVTLDSSHPDSFYAVFQAASKQYGAPPVYFVGFVTHDRGKTWQPVPAPSGDTTSSQAIERFGWFWTDGKVVQALFWGQNNTPDQAPLAVVEQTSDGGITWIAAMLACPSSGPCLRWGPATSMIGGMGAELPQTVLASQDSGQTWQSTGQSVELREIGPHELVALSENQAVLISGSADYPLRYTQDGGKTWQVLAIPPLPGTDPTASFGYPGLQMLPDGSLVALNDQAGTWWGLPPAAKDWCALAVSSLDNNAVLLQAAGDKVWWFSPSTNKPQSAPFSDFACKP